MALSDHQYGEKKKRGNEIRKENKKRKRNKGGLGQTKTEA